MYILLRLIRLSFIVVTIHLLNSYSSSLEAQQLKNKFKVIAFYTAKHDLAHISFVQEANMWFSQMSSKNNFIYESTNDWTKLNSEFLSHYQVVIFLDTRPDSVLQREAFRKYMEEGGAWMGFHFAAFALTPSAYPQNWNWYHEDFLGVGQYKSNTWRPTAAILEVEDRQHPATIRLPKRFKSSPNEWYCWINDLKKRKDMKVLLSIDASSFPLGTGPKPHEIWHSGYYPVAWTNINFKMIYFNMGHNDMDYENKTNKQLSYTFNNKVQDKLILNSLLWLGGHSKKSK